MKNKKLILIIALVVVILAGSVTGLLIGLGLNGGDQSSTSSKINPDDIIWVDSADPDPETEKDPEVTSPRVSYPEKPATAPIIDNTVPTTVGDLSANNECYTLTQETNGLKISYDGGYDALPAYSYVYIPVDNYQAKYSYLKIKANCTGVERIAIIGIYYEMYEQNRPGVTVYNNSVLEGENVIICNLNDGVVLNEHYDVLNEEKITQKTIIGFMLMIDSNPKQLIADSQGEMLISSVGLVDANDEDIKLLDSAPIISSWSTTSPEYNDFDIYTFKSETTGSMNAWLDYSFTSGYPYFVAQIHNYKSEYTTLRMKLKGVCVKNVTIAIAHAFSSSATNAPYNYLTFGMKVSSEFETYEFDFSTLEELVSFEGEATVPGSYIKNLKPTAIYFYIDTADLTTGGLGTLYVEDMEFVKVVDDGLPKVTSTWAVTGANITKKDVMTGGIGTLTYTETQGWTPVSVSVNAFNVEYTVLVVKVKFYGADNLGIALGYGSSNTVILGSNGDISAEIILSHETQNGTDDNGDYVFHTYTIDFANKPTDTGTGLLKDQSINKIMFYIDAVAKIGGVYEPVNPSPLNSPRTMQFVGIEFKKPEVQNG